MSINTQLEALEHFLYDYKRLSIDGNQLIMDWGSHNEAFAALKDARQALRDIQAKYGKATWEAV